MTLHILITKHWDLERIGSVFLENSSFCFRGKYADTCTVINTVRIYTFLHVFNIYLCVRVWWCVCACVYMDVHVYKTPRIWRLEDNVWEFAYSFHHVGSAD